MKISVITSAYNSAETIGDTLDSVRQQDYPSIEYIVVDGASSDGTMDIVAEYDDIVSLSISEPDGGIYDALNKGIALATGDVVGFLHSDDLFADPGRSEQDRSGLCKPQERTQYMVTSITWKEQIQIRFTANGAQSPSTQPCFIKAGCQHTQRST